MSNDRIYWIVEHKYGVKSLHKVINPAPSKKGFYRAAISTSYFQDRELKFWDKKVFEKNLDIDPLSHYCMVYYNPDWECRLRMERSMQDNYFKDYLEPELNLPYNVHNTIWEFYKFVGYDYKKQRYIKEP